MASGSIFYSLKNGNSNTFSFPFADNRFNTPEKLASFFKGTDGVPKITQIVGLGVATTYLEGVGWVGNLNTLQPENGYILSASAVTASITGALIPMDYTKQFDSMPQLLSFPGTTTGSLSGSLNPSASLYFQSICDGENSSNKTVLSASTWSGSLTSFSPGKAYYFRPKQTPSIISSSYNQKQILSALVGGFELNPFWVGYEYQNDSGEEYVRCSHGDNIDTGFIHLNDDDRNSILPNSFNRSDESGYRCLNTLANFEKKNRVGEGYRKIKTPCTFAHVQSTHQSFIMMIDSFNGTSSLQRADSVSGSLGRDITGDAIVGVFSTRNQSPFAFEYEKTGSSTQDICLGTSIWSTHKDSTMDSTIQTNHLSLNDNTFVINIPFNINDSGSWNHGGGKGIPNTEVEVYSYYPKSKVSLKFKVYDPLRGRVYPAKLYNGANDQELTISGSNNSIVTMWSGSLTSGSGKPMNIGWHYLKTEY